MDQYKIDRLFELLEILKGVERTQRTSLIGSSLNFRINKSHIETIENLLSELITPSSPVSAIQHENAIIIHKTEKGSFNVFTKDKWGDRLGWDEMIGLISAITMPDPRPCLAYLSVK